MTGGLGGNDPRSSAGSPCWQPAEAAACYQWLR